MGIAAVAVDAVDAAVPVCTSPPCAFAQLDGTNGPMPLAVAEGPDGNRDAAADPVDLRGAEHAG